MGIWFDLHLLWVLPYMYHSSNTVIVSDFLVCPSLRRNTQSLTKPARSTIVTTRVYLRNYRFVWKHECSQQHRLNMSIALNLIILPGIIRGCTCTNISLAVFSLDYGFVTQTSQGL